MTRGQLSPTSAGRVMWAVAASDGPVTVEEIAEILSVKPQSVGAQTRRLYESGCLVRRKRYQEGAGKHPYEYNVLRP